MTMLMTTVTKTIQTSKRASAALGCKALVIVSTPRFFLTLAFLITFPLFKHTPYDWLFLQPKSIPFDFVE
jgi:hypothetical protein